MKVIKIVWLSMIVILCGHKIYAQGTLKITIEQAEKQFLERNLQVLAERYHIHMADAAVVQAKLLNNPTVGVGDVNFWHPNVADLSPASSGNKIVFAVELEQMIRTAGKRRKLVDLEKVSKEVTGQEFEAFLLGLKTELRTVLHETIYLQSYAEIIQLLLESVDTLVEVYKNQASAGNIAKSEPVRLQSSLIELETEANEVQTALNKQYREIKTLLNILPNAEIWITAKTVTPKNPLSMSLPNLLEMASNARPEFLLSELSVRYHEKLLRYEQSQRSPDVGVSLHYDRYGGVWKDFVGMGVRFDIPVFNRNQGKIKIAELQLEQNNYYAENQRNTIMQEIVEIYNNYSMSYHFYEKLLDNDFSEDLESMLEVYSRNLLNKNINMLEYIDFMYAYKTTKQAILIAKKNVDVNFAELQCSVNSEIK